MSRSAMVLETAKEILGYSFEELEKVVRTNNMLLYRNADDKAFLALVVAVNDHIYALKGFKPSSHVERRFLREMGREDLRALYSDMMKTLHEEAFYEGVYQPEEVRYAVEKIGRIIEELESEISGRKR